MSPQIKNDQPVKAFSKARVHKTLHFVFDQTPPTKQEAYSAFFHIVDKPTPFRRADKRQDEALIRILETFQDDTDFMHEIVTAKNANGLTLLHKAAAAGNTAIVKKLLEAGANPREKTPSTGMTPLHYAALSKNPETALTLIMYGADLDAQNTLGNTPLHYAYSEKARKVITLLKSLGASQSIRNKIGCTPSEYSNERALQTIQKESIETQNEPHPPNLTP
jgi:ankyrin repeat protein